MATPKIDNSTKIEQSGFGISFKSANPAEYPIAYQDDLWDVVDKTSNLAKVLNTQSDGQYDQHSINEELSKGIVDSVKLADLEEGITVGYIEAKSILIDGTPPSLEGHKHTVSDITDLPDQLISIEHADLLAKVNNSELVPG